MRDGIQLEVVGVDDAARAMILAAEHGRIGERYLISERMIGLKEVVRIAADEAGVPPPQRSISVPMLYALGAFGTLKARLTGKDAELSLASVRMMRAEAEVDADFHAGWIALRFLNDPPLAALCFRMPHLNGSIHKVNLLPTYTRLGRADSRVQVGHEGGKERAAAVVSASLAH